MFSNNFILINTKNIYGFKKFNYRLLLSRLELNFHDNLFSLSGIQKLLFDLFSNNFSYNTNTFKTRHLLNIYLLNLLGTYRGWRHSRGLPVRGQRTWSNSWSSYRSNLALRSFKINIAKRIYGNNFSNEYFTAYIAEEVNNMWRLQWESEWLDARKKRLNSLKNPMNIGKIDLASISKMQVGQFGKKSLKSKKSKKNVFTLGFDPGFTKSILKTSIISTQSNKKSK